MSNAGNSTLKHRSCFDLYGLQKGCDPFQRAAELVCSWLIEKESCYESSPIVDDFAGKSAFPQAWNYAMPEDYQGGDYNDDRWPALACKAWRDDLDRITCWIVEYDEPDTSHDDRRWHTTICLEPQDNGSCRVGIQIACRPLDPDAEPLQISAAAPALVRSIIDLPWYMAKIDPTQLFTVPHKLSSQTFDDFERALTDPERAIPLVLFCTGLNGNMPDQAKQLARRALGTTNVYVLDWSNEELRDKLQSLFKRGTAAGEYACPKSSCRMYMPGIDLTDPNHSMSHELWDRKALDAMPASKFAERHARRFMPATPIPTIQHPSWDQIR